MIRLILITLLFCASNAIAQTQQKATEKKKLDLLPSSTGSTTVTTLPPSGKSTGDIDMNQFKNVAPAKKDPRVDLNVSCTMPDGTVRKQTDVGFRECMETKGNRILNQPQSPEATPYDPRTD